MKKIKYLLLTVVISSSVFMSCSEDKMDDINKNINDPNKVESKFILTDVFTNSAFSVTGSDLAFYTSVYSELLGGAHAQMYNAQERDGEPQLSSTYNNSWNNIYKNLRSLKIITSKCSPGGNEVGNYHTLGIAQVMTAYNLGVLTDLWGDVPYFEALEPIKNPQSKVDKQSELYKEIFRLLDEAVNNLEKKSSYNNIGKQDLIYKGNIEKWKKAAFGLKARYLMHLSAVQPNYQLVIDNVDQSFKNLSEDLSFNDSKVPYPFYLFWQQRRGLFSSKTLYDLMYKLDKNDPRLKDYFPLTKDKQLVLVDHSKDIVQSQTYYSASGLSDGFDNGKNYNNSIYLMSYHELLFIKAEAQARLGNAKEAIATLELAIKAGLMKKQTFTYATYNRSIPQDLYGDVLLKRIAAEKYISFFEVESIEAYNDIRRWKAMGENLIELKHKNPSKFPKRLTYGNSDVSNNSNIGAIFGDGTYVYTENVWWAKGTR